MAHCLAAWACPESRCRRGTPGWTIGVTRQPFCRGAVGMDDRSDGVRRHLWVVALMAIVVVVMCGRRHWRRVLVVNCCCRSSLWVFRVAVNVTHPDGPLVCHVRNLVVLIRLVSEHV